MKIAFYCLLAVIAGAYIFMPMWLGMAGMEQLPATLSHNFTTVILVAAGGLWLVFWLWVASVEGFFTADTDQQKAIQQTLDYKEPRD